MYYVYIIYSKECDKYYKGFSEHPKKRLESHNNGKSRYTKSFAPRELIYVEEFKDKSEALKREKSQIKYNCCHFD